MLDFVSAFFCELDPEVAERLRAVENIEAKLQYLDERARGAWPDIEILAVDFLRYVADRLPFDRDLEGALTALHAGDLFLACGCVRGNPRALAHFESHFLSDVATYLQRKDALSDFSDEVKQALRDRLFVAGEGMLPRMASYTGRGPLKAWLRIAMTRAAIDLRRRSEPVQAESEALPEPPAAEHDPEMAYLKAHYRRELARAMRDTLTSLSDRESNVLWLRYYQGLSADAIGAAYRVSARTVQRWLDSAREQILHKTHQLLVERLKVEPSEVRQLIQLANSQLELSFSRILRRPAL